jgi:GH15 family glucan-1,4-alpha-glucosidase
VTAVPRTDRLVARSLELIEEHQADTGAYVACPTFATYNYSWFRDGAFIADAMSRYGRVRSADAFHGWAASVVDVRRERIVELVARGRAGEPVGPGEHLHTRYTLDGREGDGFWENFQLDGYGTWLWALRQHHDRHGADPVGPDVVGLTVDYLATFWHEPSYDWWEEHLEHRHTSTLASIWAGLDACADWAWLDAAVRRTAEQAARRIRAVIETGAVVDGSLTKWLGSDAVDGSLIACLTPFDLFPPDHPVACATVARVEAELAPAGVYRYLDDVYYGGGQWVLLAAFLGWHHARTGDREQAERRLAWICDQADEHNELPEQVAHDLLHPEHLEAWEDKWGPSARPLLWSHAMFLDLVHALDGPEQGAA